MSTDTSVREARTAPVTRRRRAARAGAVLGAAAAGAVVWTAAVPLLGVDLAVAQGGRPQPVGLTAVTVTAVAAGLLGWALLAALETRSRRAAGVWTAIAITVAVLSLGGPIGAGVGAAATVVLVALHAVVAAVLIPVLRRTSLAR